MNIIVLSGYGLNCEEETAGAFLMAAKILAKRINVAVMHINEVIENPKLLKNCSILAIPGGFSYGDHTGAGNALSLRIINNLSEEIQEFLTRDKLVIGICNGCQVLLKLIPDFSNITLINNDSNQYQCQWIKIKVNHNNNSFWLQDIDKMYIPIAHAEGKFYTDSRADLDLLINDDCVALRYINNQYEYANGVFPDNPNGSIYDIAGLSSKNGKVLALMPHPERAIFLAQQENWTMIKDQCLRLKTKIPTIGDGLKVFCNGLKYFN